MVIGPPAFNISTRPVWLLIEATVLSLVSQVTAPVPEPPLALRVKTAPYRTSPGWPTMDSGLCPAGRMVNILEGVPVMM